MVCMCVRCVALRATAGMSQRHVAWMRRDVVCAAWVWRRGEVCVYECGVVWWSGCSGEGDEVMCGGLMCVWRMAVCVCRVDLHDRVCGMCGCVWLCVVCVAWCVCGLACWLACGWTWWADRSEGKCMSSQDVRRHVVV